jgi:predicted ATP-grasp superfamily ATP-dependent carboligase
VRWFALNELGVEETAADDMHNEVVDWLERNDLDIAYVIRSIGSQLA